MNSNFTSTAKEYLLGESPVHTILSFTDGTATYQCTDATAQGSVVIDYACTGGQGLELGACVATQISFSLYTDGLGFGDDFNFKDFNIVTLELGVGEETILVGTFRIDGSPRMKSLVSITAFDFMTDFDKDVDMVEWQTWVGGHTLAEAVAWCCTKCGYDAPTMTGLANANRVMKTYPQEQTTYRQIISWCFMVMGVIGYMDSENNLCCKYPDRNLDYTPSIAGIAVVGNTVVGRTDGSVSPNIIKTFEPTDRFASDWDEKVKVTGLKYNNFDGTYTLVGSDDYTYDLSGNPFIDDATYMLSRLYGKINGRESTVMSMTTISVPWITPLDWVGYEVDGETYYGIVTNATHTINGHSEIACNGEIEQTVITAMSGAAASAVRQSEQRVTEKITLQAKEIEVLGEEVSLKVGADGVITAINASSEGLSIDANKININGVISANGGFMVDADGNMTANNGTFNGVVNATSGSFTGEITATSGTMDSITATNLTVNSGTFSGTLSAATGTINNVTATNLTVKGGSINIATGSAATNVIMLTYNGSGYEDDVYMSPEEIFVSYSRNGVVQYDSSLRAEGLSLNYGSGQVWMTAETSPGVTFSNSNSSASLDVTNGLVLSNASGYINIDATCNVATLSYTVVSTF